MKQLEQNEVANLNRQFPICIIAHNINHPTNVGSLFRLADAFGVEKMFLTGSTSVPPNKKISKTSRATEKYVNYEYFSNPFEVIDILKTRGFLIASIEITDNSIPLSALLETNFDKIALIIGAENYGVNEQLLLQSDAIVHLPMYGKNSSINVAMATAITVYEITQKIES